LIRPILGACISVWPVLAVAPCLTPESMFDLRSVSDARIHSSGQMIAFVESRIDKMSDVSHSRILLWANGTASALHEGKLHERSPRWSPDGRYLVYISDSGGKPQTHLRETSTGRERILTQVTGVGSELVWSPDGKYLAYFSFVPAASRWNPPMPAPPAGAAWAPPPVVVTSLRYAMDGSGVSSPGSSHLFVASVDGGPPRQVSAPPYWHTSYTAGVPEVAWTADGNSLIAAAIRAPEAWSVYDESSFYAFPIDGKGVPQRLGPEKWHQRDPAVSPDGKHLAWSGFHWKGQSYHIGQLYVSSGAGQKRSLTPSLDRDPQQLLWSADGSKIWFLAEDRGDVNIMEASPQGGTLKKLTSRHQRIHSFTVSANGVAAAIVSSPERPPVLMQVDLKQSNAQEMLYDPNAEFLRTCTFLQPEEVQYRSFDGRMIHGWILKPPRFDARKKYPLLVAIHGGPHAMYANNFQHDLQMFAGEGYVTLYTNPRGSTGYGEEFAKVIQHRWPGDDIKDVLSGVDHVVNLGYVDPARMGVIGGSGGGLMTSWTITQTDRFRAAVAWWPVTNWITHVGSADNGFYIGSVYRRGMPWEHPQDYIDHSPLFHVSKIQTPTMIITGEEDWRTPIAQSNEFYRALKIRGVDTVYVRMPGESHGSLKRTSHRVAVLVHSLAWLQRYLKPAGVLESAE
jgi:dipeptidyl aminopeptidase/acylaminoacyl peptidase